MILCDLLLILSHQNSSSDEAVGLLEYLPSMSLQSKMLLFIQDHVFTEEEEEFKGQLPSWQGSKPPFVDAIHPLHLTLSGRGTALTFFDLFHIQQLYL